MRDSLYNLYPVPFTKMYFHTFIITPDGNITNEEFSDTTTCRNGWGLKELNFSLNNKHQKVVSGASKFSNMSGNYHYVVITYDEFLNYSDNDYFVMFIKTFGIN